MRWLSQRATNPAVSRTFHEMKFTRNYGRESVMCSTAVALSDENLTDKYQYDSQFTRITRFNLGKYSVCSSDITSTDPHSHHTLVEQFV